jgi:hypothetical protein
MNATPHVAQNTNGRSCRRSTAAPRDTPDTPSANESANGSRKPSAGSRRSSVRSEPSSTAANVSDGPSPSRPPPTTRRGCPNCWRRRYERRRRRTANLSAAGGSLEPTSHDRDYLNLCGPATITITDHGRGEIAFGALQAGLDIEYSRSSVGFTWEGVRRNGRSLWRRLSRTQRRRLDRDRIAYHIGDEAVLKAKPDTSSTAC